MEQYIVDRIEGGYAVLTAESGESKSFPLPQLPDDVREGMTLLRGPDGAFVPDAADPRARHERIRAKFDSMFED